MERENARERRMAQEYEQEPVKEESITSSRRMREWIREQRSTDKRQAVVPSPTLSQGVFTEFLVQMRLREDETGTRLSAEQINELVRAIQADRATRDRRYNDKPPTPGQVAPTGNGYGTNEPIHPSWDTRVALQRWRNSAIAQHEYTEIPDQGIVFDEDGTPRERPRSQRRDADGGSAKDMESNRQRRVRTAITVPTGIPPNSGALGGGNDTSSHRRPRQHERHAIRPYADLPPVGRRARSRERSPSTDNGDGDAMRGQHPRESARVRMNEPDEVDVNRRHRSRLTSEDLDVGRHDMPGQSSSYHRAIERRYLSLIKEQLGKPLILPSGVKPPSGIPKPDKYSGESDVEIFNNWLQSLLRWLRLQLYGGDNRDSECVAMVGLFVDGKAATWYNDEVDGMYRRHQSWTFARVILDMYDRFVQPTAMQDATEQFYAVEYTTAGGVRGFYDDLDRKAARMIHSVDAYTFRRQFLMGLPSYIRNVIIDRGYTAERHRLKEIYRVAIQVEEGQIITKHYAVASSKRAANSAHAVGKPHTGPRKFTRGMPHNGNESRPYSNGQRKIDNPITANPVIYNGNAKVERKEERPAKGPTINRAPRPGAPRQVNSGPSQSRCYACGNLGHFASDPTCPKRQQPKMFAVRDLRDDDDQSVAMMTPDGVDNAGRDDTGVEDDRPNEYNRSRYSSPTSEDDKSQSEHGDEPEEGDDNDRIAAMNDDYGERMFAMRNTAQEQQRQSHPTENRVAVWPQGRRYIARPQRTSDEKAVLAMLVDIGGEQAFTLFDSGCTTDSLSPEYARIAKIPYGHLKEPVPLQLGTVGSSSKINFGAEATLKLGPIVSKMYFDIANLDRYDAIIGTPTMRKYGIVLDFAEKCVRIGNRTFDALREGEETRVMARRHSIQRRQ
ncbi:hypothetical protein PC9H_007128 [Pleurotus ostreatus]|uniref:CCHC-type domain-containing protein n=1 Tax=Pleurotus ostreatus TaxID=5322 RepID=A0A8H6ZT00_PLEOS|nr:uncharacterized protein PC9H_007128 [Pleurotus ostreatus]KAF7427911.1 hypothetical protein PC9H_007128 [Pleurotus ostreatus]KAJ8695934.1 hypothetical protein PTI98_005841 [Pleurotus ostreatus]